MRNTMRKWMLGLAMVAGVTGALGAGATKAEAAQFRVGVAIGAPVAEYVPPCPGDGYFWTAGYYNGGYWVPGRWAFRGPRYERPYVYSRGFHYDRGYGFRGRR